MRYYHRSGIVGNFEQEKKINKRRLFHLFKNRRRTIRKQEQEETLWRQNNPYKDPYKPNFRPKIALILLFLTLIAWVILIIYLPFFRINNIMFNGLNVIKHDEIDGEIRNNFLTGGKIFPKNSYFFLSTSKIEKDLTKKFSLEKVKVSKDFPDTLKVELKERISVIIYDNGKNYFLINKNGEIIKNIKQVGSNEFELKNQSETTTLPAQIANNNNQLYDFNTSSTVLNQIGNKIHVPDYKGLSKDFINYPILYDKRVLKDGQEIGLIKSVYIDSMIDFYSELTEQGIADIKYLEMEHPMAGIKAYTNKNWYILFQPQNNISKQIENLKTILTENKPTSYIDLRYEDKVYWK